MKIDFELHICCYEYDLSNITNWQHISRGTPGRNCGRNFCPPRPGTINFHLWCRFFSGFDKINTFWQQKQLLLFLSNITSKVFLCCFFVAATLLTAPQRPQTQKNDVFWGFSVQNCSPSTIWGVEISGNTYFLNLQKKNRHFL